MRRNAMHLAAALGLMILLAPSVAAGETNIAVIDVARVFEDYQMTRDLEGRFEDIRRAISDEAGRRHNSIEQMRRGLAAFDPSSEDFARREKDLMRAEVDFQVWTAHEERRLKADHKRWLLRIYRNTQGIVAQVAEERKVDLVLTYDTLTADAPDSGTLRQQILLQKVIYHSDRLDITGEVLDRLNKAYQADGGVRSLDQPLPVEPPRADVSNAEPAAPEKPNP